MTANELADELDKCYFYEGVISKSATMLRQQQAEIEQLKYDLSVNENYLLLERQYNEKLWKQLNPMGKAQEK